MGILICPDCGGKVSEHVKACPHCGCPIDYIKIDTFDSRIRIDGFYRCGSRSIKFYPDYTFAEFHNSDIMNDSEINTALDLLHAKEAFSEWEKTSMWDAEQIGYTNGFGIEDPDGNVLRNDYIGYPSEDIETDTLTFVKCNNSAFANGEIYPQSDVPENLCVEYETRRSVKPFEFFDTSVCNVLIGNTIDKIEKFAFMDCPRIEYVYIDSSVKQIEDYAFRGYRNSAVICLHENTKYGEHAFDDRTLLVIRQFDDITFKSMLYDACVNNSIDAIANIGGCYENGEVVAQDYSKAVVWLEKAAWQNHPEACNHLGNIYADGKGNVKQDYNNACFWYEKGSELGSAYAMANLGNLYLNGNGVEKDYKHAMELFINSEKQNNEIAEYGLGLCYLNGYGVEKNPLEALAYFQKASDKGDSLAQYNLAVLYSNGEFGIKRDYNKAAILYRKSADQGVASAQHNLGTLYYDGNGVTQSYYEALKWYRKAAEQGYPLSQYSMGCMYYNGTGVSQDYQESFKWFERSAKQGIAEAQYNMAIYYQKGHIVEQNATKSFNWMLKAADQDLSIAQLMVSTYYWQGYGTSKDSSKAFMWGKMAAENGNVKAQHWIGLLYKDGDGVSQSYSEAIKWFKIAASNGNKDSQDMLNEMSEIY